MTTAQKTPSTYRDAAVTLWGEAGAYAHDSYRRLLPLYPGLPDEIPIVIGITAYGRCMGLSRLSWDHGPRITLHSGAYGFAAGHRWVDDIMAHEMLHCWLYVTGQFDPKKSHGKQWYDGVRRLSPDILGSELNIRYGGDRKSVRIKQDDGTSIVRKVRDLDAVPHDDVARWPHTFRPKGYDYGNSIPVPTY